MWNKWNKDTFVRNALWDMYVYKKCDMCIITDTDRKGETFFEGSLMIMSYAPLYHYHKMDYEEFYIWAWQPIVENKGWQKALINSYIENRGKNDYFDIFEYCCDEVIDLVKEIEKDRETLSEEEFKKEYFWNR